MSFPVTITAKFAIVHHNLEKGNKLQTIPSFLIIRLQPLPAFSHLLQQHSMLEFHEMKMLCRRTSSRYDKFVCNKIKVKPKATLCISYSKLRLVLRVTMIDIPKPVVHRKNSSLFSIAFFKFNIVLAPRNAIALIIFRLYCSPSLASRSKSRSGSRPNKWKEWSFSA